MTEARLTCWIQDERSIDALARNRPAFAPLSNARPDPDAVSHWEVEGEPRQLLEVLVLGKTGYGKSTLFNKLTGFPVFETSDVEACTRKMQSAEFRFDRAPGHRSLSFTDLPGIGESSAHDTEYLDLYQAALESAHAVIYVLRADQRDFTIDDGAFDTLGLVHRKRSFSLALTCIDKIEPLNRCTPFRMSRKQTDNLERKIDYVQSHFGIRREQIVPVSAIEDIGLDALAERVVSALAPYLEGVSERRP